MQTVWLEEKARVQGNALEGCRDPGLLSVDHVMNEDLEAFCGGWCAFDVFSVLMITWYVRNYCSMRTIA